MPCILVADDDRSIRVVLEQALRKNGYDAMLTDNISELMRWAHSGLGDAIITDVIIPSDTQPANIHTTALDMLPGLRHVRPELPVIVISAQSTLMTAVKAHQAGAYDYLPKPFDLHELMDCLRKATQPAAISTAPAASAETLSHPSVIGNSAAMQHIYRMLSRVVGVSLTVLIHGESGTGKELIARAIHDLGPRRHKPFIAVNMAAIPRELVESELFGHEKGAFTGATARKAGTFEAANGGTVFLDEIGDMPLEAQTKLLRVLQQGEFNPVGGSRTLKTDVRIICASHRNLEALVQDGLFREDLFYRVNVIPLTVPPLRERADDIPRLAEHFLEKGARHGLSRKILGRDALVAMQAYHWPGNVRELENLIYRLCTLITDEVIDEAAVRRYTGGSQGETLAGPVSLEALVTEHLSRYFQAHEGQLPPSGVYDRIMQLVEKPLILEALKATRGNQLKTAELLGINRNTLRKKITELGLLRKSSVQ